ncbi:MAG: hypothetical protein ACRDRL_10825, partial [Sciscionella sp.]
MRRALPATIVVAGIELAGCSSSTSGGAPTPRSTDASTASVPTPDPVSTQPDASNPYTHPELPAAEAIKGMTYHVESDHTHMPGVLKYDSTPPVGGDHSQYWADCSG